MIRRTILVIDDSKAIRFLIQAVLGKDYQVVTAPDACSAMQWLAKKELPDLIIVDPQLPDVQEWELVGEFTSSILYRDIPLIVLSAFDKATTAAKCYQYGVADYFIRPFNPLELSETVQRVMSKTVPVAK